jgi:hypothetical protein
MVRRFSTIFAAINVARRKSVLLTVSVCILTLGGSFFLIDYAVYAFPNTAHGNASISDTATHSQPRDDHACVAASMPLNKLKYLTKNASVC